MFTIRSCLGVRPLSLSLLLAWSAVAGAGPYDAWKHSAPLWIVTTPDGADLPASCSEKDFPLLVRLVGDTFDFTQADPQGADIRFSDGRGEPLAYEVEQWDAAHGAAAIWVRIPLVTGNTQQAIRMHWGRVDAVSESNGRGVFDVGNGHVVVFHMDDPVADDGRTLAVDDTGTIPWPGVIGPARRFDAGRGVGCGETLDILPTGSGPHSTSVWVKPERANVTLVAWGNEEGQGKVVMQLGSPPHVAMDCYFSGANVRSEGTLTLGRWMHVVHTHTLGGSRIYVDGALVGESTEQGSPLNIKKPARLSLGGWYANYGFVGGMDEVRLSSVTRSPDWVRLEYENQKPLQSLVGPPVTGEGVAVASPTRAEVREGETATVTVTPGAARAWSWVIVRDGREEVVAVNQPRFVFAAGRVSGDEHVTIRCKVLQSEGVQIIDIPVTVREAIPEPTVTLRAPGTWDGRTPLEVVAVIGNRDALAASDAADLDWHWAVTGGAVTSHAEGDRLRLTRSQYTGPISVRVTVGNGGASATATAVIAVAEPGQDAWVVPEPGADEKPVDGRFYARDASNRGTLVWAGRLEEPADEVRLEIRADGRRYAVESRKPDSEGRYSLSSTLAPGLVVYEAELATVVGGTRTVLETVTDIVCGDVLVIQGQSNALATDTQEQAPRESHPWIRSYADVPPDGSGRQPNGWCRPVWKRELPDQTETGWWGMELGKRIVQHHQMPVCILNGAVGGTRIDQHQRNDGEPTDPATIYGRLLRRVRAAGLTHGVRAILWHQGENNQGAAGPSGDFDWKTYQELFVELASDWKEDYPNLRHYYLFQIWPDACAMGRGGDGDMLREKQRTLPRLFSHMEIQATLGVRPPGGCHYPLAGWAEFAGLVEPLIARDLHGVESRGPLTSPNLVRAVAPTAAANTVVLEFDQPVVWHESSGGQFHVDGQPGRVTGGRAAGNVLTLTLGPGPAARTITYVRETSWSQDELLLGANGLAALSFCDVAVETGE